MKNAGTAARHALQINSNSYFHGTGLVQQPVQIAARFAITI
jgi:hypothetical protein